MRSNQSFSGFSKAVVLAGVLVSGTVFAQQEQAQPVPQQNVPKSKATMSDAQIQANILKAFAGAPKLANQDIESSTTYGTVTLSGNVTDEDSRKMADDLASRVAGVQKVIDEMQVGGAVAQGPDQDPAQGPPQQAAGQPQSQNAPYPPSGYPQTNYPGAPEYPQGQAQNPPPPPQGYPQQRTNYPPQGYPQQSRNYPPQGYPQQGGPDAYGAQRAGDPVTIASGTMLRIRINEGLSSNRSTPGSGFDGVVLNDVVADGAVAIPRGATVQGEVVDSKASGALSGRGELTLALTHVILTGKTYPLVTDTWSRASGDKTAHTVNSALGLGVLGAIIGGVAGGGSGAAIGAAAGGATGVAASAASPGGKVLIPAEAMLTFHVTQPATVMTVSQAEMDRLGYGMSGGRGPAMQQRRQPPPPPYYGRPY